MEKLIGDRTRAIVVINPNNPSGAVYGRETLKAIVALAERHGLVVLADEIYDQMVYDDAEFFPLATMVDNTVCLTYSGLSKIYRACGYRVGWCVFSGELDQAEDYIHGMELLSALRLCSNVPGQWAVQTALGGFQSIDDLVQPGGRLYQSRQAIIDRVEQSGYLSLQRPMGAMYAFIRLAPRFGDVLGPIQGCGDYQRLLPAFLDGGLAPSRALLLEEHTRHCVPCRRALKIARSGGGVEILPGQRQRDQLARRSGGRRWLAAAAAVIAVVAAGYLLWSSTSSLPFGAVVEATGGGIYRAASLEALTVGSELAVGERLLSAPGESAYLRLPMARGSRSGDVPS